MHLVSRILDEARGAEEQLRAKVANLEAEIGQCETDKRKALHKSAETNRALEAQLKTAQKETSKCTFVDIRKICT